MLVLYFAGFTLALVLLALGLLGLFQLAENGVLGMPQDSWIDKMTAALEKGSYASIPVRRWMGDGAFFQVTDESGQVFYSSNPGFAYASYTPEELACLPRADSAWYTLTDEYTDASGRKLTEFTFYNMTDSGDYSVRSVLIVDKSLNVVYSSEVLPDNATSLTRTQFNMLQGVLGSYTVYRLPFTQANGQSAWALCFFPPVGARQEKILQTLYALEIPALCAAYVVLIVFFIVLLTRRVKRPLALLSAGMEQLAGGSRGAQLEYRGPAEFEQMCTSFNTLSTRLYEAEQNRAAAEASKRKVLADLSHDLKTPVTVIQGYAKAVRDGVVPADQQQAYLHIIEQKSVALGSLVDTLCTYSQLDHPDFSLHVRRANVCEVVREYLAGRYDEIELACFALEAEIPDADLAADVDVPQFARALDNLVGNALKHNAAGTHLHVRVEGPLAAAACGMAPDALTGSAPVCVREKAPAGRNAGSPAPAAYARILVEDTGGGIPPEVAPHVFEPFAVGDESRTAKHGSGLGLAITKRILEAHGGTAMLLAPAGEWHTRFALVLPLAGGGAK